MNDELTNNELIVKKYKSKYFLVACILLTLIMVVSLSYAYFLFTDKQTNTNIVKSTCLSFELKDQKNDINLQSAFPILDEEGKKLTPFTFTVKNTCDAYMSYTINLESLAGTTLSNQYVKVMLNNEAIVNLSTLEDAPLYYEDSVGSKILGKYSLGTDEEEEFTLRLWMNEDTPAVPEAMSKTMLSKIVVNATISNYDPVTEGINTLHDAILANEYQVTDVQVAKDKIAAKQEVDTTKTAPIIDWQKNISSAPVTNVASATLPAKSLIGTEFDVTENETKVRLGKSYTFNSETGYYNITDYDYYDPTTVNYGEADYYFCGGGYSIDAKDKIATYWNNNNCTYIYKITSTSIDSKTTTATNSVTNTQYAVTKYLFTGYKLDQVELESDKSDRGLYQAEDDYGTTYYYRGSVKNNYVYFGGFYWQIIRINGDGSIRMMYAGKTPNASGSATYIKGAPFNKLRDNPAYVGYMYGNTLNTSLEQTQANEVSSNAKTELEAWYKTNIADKGLGDYVADSGFCNDRTLSTRNNNGDGVIAPATKTTYYATYDRYYTTKTPTYKCANAENDLFTTSAASVGNNSATYPVGLITVDELMYAGITNGYMNRLTYVYQNTYYWTMSPSYFNATNASALEFYLNPAGFAGRHWVTNSLGLRPVINLKSDTLIESGVGTAANPYVVDTN